MKNVVLFDLGNTLVRYFGRAEFPGILEQAIAEVQEHLRREGRLHIPSEDVWQGVEKENHESQDHRVRPLEERLARIFRLDESIRSSDLMAAVCRRFMVPLYAWGRLYDDTLPALGELRSKGVQTAIVSNTPWGSPADLWREELERLGLANRVDVVVFCRDVGWRKPARQVFDYTLDLLRVRPQQCLFVGDDPRWDLVGPRALGIDAILIDRDGTMQHTEEEPIRDLYELRDRMYEGGGD